MNKKSKSLIGVFLVSFLLFVVLSPLRMLKMEQATIATCVVFQAFTVLALSRCHSMVKPEWLMIVILVGSSLVDIPIRICYFSSTLLSFPEFVGRVISILVGYGVFKVIQKKR